MRRAAVVSLASDPRTDRDLLLEILARLERLEAATERGHRDRHTTDQPLMDAIGKAIGPREFVVDDLLVLANGDASLRLALNSCGIDSDDPDAGKLLGQRLKKLEGRVVGAYTLDWIKNTRLGVRRRLRVCGL